MLIVAAKFTLNFLTNVIYYASIMLCSSIKDLIAAHKVLLETVNATLLQLNEIGTSRIANKAQKPYSLKIARPYATQ